MFWLSVFLLSWLLGVFAVWYVLTANAVAIGIQDSESGMVMAVAFAWPLSLVTVGPFVAFIYWEEKTKERLKDSHTPPLPKEPKPTESPYRD